MGNVYACVPATAGAENLTLPLVLPSNARLTGRTVLPLASNNVNSLIYVFVPGKSVVVGFAGFVYCLT